MLPPSAIAGVSLICAFGPWLFSDPAALRVVAALAAATAVVGAAVMRRWDTQAGKQVADLTRARVSDEWRFEERVAELETDLEESRELRGKLEQRLRAKRAELAGLRNEHAALLRRYATAETERASALEGRRLLEIETTAPVRELPPAPVSAGAAAEGNAEKAEERKSAAEVAGVETDVEEPETPAVFSPEGAKLFLRANEALGRLAGDRGEGAAAIAVADSAAGSGSGSGDTEAAQEDEAEGQPEAAGEHTRAAATHPDGEERGSAERAEGAEDAPRAEEGEGGDAAAVTASPEEPEASAVFAPSVEPARAAGRADAVDRSEAAPAPAAPSTAVVPRPAAPVQRPAGHFTVPTAVAVVPATQPVRRPTAEGGFDFFGTKKPAPPEALEAVQNEDLADVVGQEALALHKAETEAGFKPAGEDARVVGQVIDLTVHDETEQIDLQGLRSAVS